MNPSPLPDPEAATQQYSRTTADVRRAQSIHERAIDRGLVGLVGLYTSRMIRLDYAFMRLHAAAQSGGPLGAEGLDELGVMLMSDELPIDKLHLFFPRHEVPAVADEWIRGIRALEAKVERLHVEVIKLSRAGGASHGDLDDLQFQLLVALSD